MIGWLPRSPEPRCGALSTMAKAVAAVGILATPLLGQQVAPQAGTLPELSLPPTRAATLSNGARVLLVRDPGAPLVTVRLMVPGGGATEPRGKEGLRGMVAGLLAAGTADRSGLEIRQAVAELGSVLTAQATPDLLRIDLRSLADELQPGLEIMAEVVTGPLFPDRSLEDYRSGLVQAMERRTGDPAGLVEQFFLAEAYGDHPYGRQPSRTSMRDITRGDLVAWHRTHVRPEGAMFVVSGDVTLDEIAATLESTFGSWAGAPPEAQRAPAAFNRAKTEVVLVDRPGMRRAEVRVGHLLPEATDPDWPVIQVAAQILGDGDGSWLDRRLRLEGAYSVDAFAAARRRAGQGYLEMGFSAGNRSVGAALDGVLTALGRLRDQRVPASELGRIRDRVLGEQLLALETSEDVADHLARDHGLGLPSDAARHFRARVADLTQEEIRRVSRSRFRPGQMVIVVAGDAAELRPDLEPFGPVRVMNVWGEATEQLRAGEVEASEDFSGEGLTPLTARYGVLLQGREVGRSTRTLEVLADTLLRFGTTASLGPQGVEQSVTVRSRDLAFVSSEVRIRAMGRELTGSLRRRGDRIVGTLQAAGESVEVDVAAGEDVLVADMLELVVWVAELEVGRVFSVPVLDVQSGEVEAVRLNVVERRDDLTDGSGGSLGDVFVVEVEASDPQTLYARAEAPHVVVLLQPASQPVDVVLRSLTPGVSVSEGGEGGGSSDSGPGPLDVRNDGR